MGNTHLQSNSEGFDHPLFHSTVKSKDFGSTTRREQRKFKKYEDLAAQGIFVPIAIETSGVWGKEGRHMIQKIGSKISNLTSEARSTYYLMQRISIAVQRGNVASILGTFPSGKELNEIFYF